MVRALGASVRDLRATNPELANRVADRLRAIVGQRARSAGGEELRVAALDALAPLKDPTMLRNAMAFAGVQPVDTVMIGDTSFDMRMAGNAGVRGFGVAWGYHPREELMASGAEAVADTYAHLADLLVGA